MTELHMCEPVTRFSGLADLYAKHRPTYPADAINCIIRRCQLGPGATLVDIGCGTGIASRQFAERGIPVVGVEPNAEMRAKAEAALTGSQSLRLVAGLAEATGLPDGCAAAVLAAQAFHWFDAPRALAEFHRLLQPGGHVALIWNERDESDPFTVAYGAIIRTAPDAATFENPRVRSGEALLRCDRFEAGERLRFQHEQVLDEEGLLGRAFSVSYAPKEPAAAAKYAEALRRLFREHSLETKVTLRYETTLFLARRR